MSRPDLDYLKARLELMAATGVSRATFEEGRLTSVEFFGPVPPPYVPPLDDTEERPPGPVDAAMIALAGRRRAEKSADE